MNKLFMAIQKNDYALVENLINQGVNVNEVDDEDKTALMYAIELLQPDIAKLLIENKADLQIADNSDNTALTYGLMYGDYELNKYILDAGYKFSENALDLRVAMIYSRKESYQLTNLLIEYGVDQNRVDSDGWNAVMEAVEWGNHLGLRALLENGGDMAIKCPTYGRNPFMHAFMSPECQDDCRIEVVKLLIAHGADIYSKDKSGKTIFDYEDQIIHNDLFDFIVQFRNHKEEQETLDSTIKECGGQDVVFF